MPFSPTSPVTGSAQTGLTSPTYTIVSVPAPDSNGTMYAVSALGGTQTGVDVNTVSSPFTATFWRPKTFKSIGSVNPVTGELESVPRNVWKLNIRKGVKPLSGQRTVNALMGVTFDIPAGADLVDPEDIRAMLSFGIGVLTQLSASLGDSLISGT